MKNVFISVIELERYELRKKKVCKQQRWPEPGEDCQENANFKVLDTFT